MKMPKVTIPTRAEGRSQKVAGRAREPKIHPVIIYPFRPSGDYSDLKALYGLVGRMDGQRERYTRPITVMDRKTHYRLESNKAFVNFRNDAVARYSDILDAWCVDTCQMWYTGLGKAFEEGSDGDVYWLIPGDFNYGTTVGQEVLGGLHALPAIILYLTHDVSIAELPPH